MFSFKLYFLFFVFPEPATLLRQRQHQERQRQNPIGGQPFVITPSGAPPEKRQKKKAAKLLVGVLGRLDLADLCRSAVACRTLHRVATDDRLLWRARCLYRFGPASLESRSTSDSSSSSSSWEQHWNTLDQHFRHGCKLFNQKASTGIEYLVSHHVLRLEPEAFVDFVDKTPGLYKKSIGWFLGQRAKDCAKDEETNLDDIETSPSDVDFYSQVAQLYMSRIDFRNLTVDEALRQLLLKIKLPGSSQFIRRILKDFALVYFKQNKEEAQRLFTKPEGPYIAAYSILMLNTDLHHPQVSRKMKKNEFADHFSAMLPGLPREYVDGVYDRIRAAELKIAEEDAVNTVTNGEDSTTTTTPPVSSPDAPSSSADGRGIKGFFSRFF